MLSQIEKLERALGVMPRERLGPRAPRRSFDSYTDSL